MATNTRTASDAVVRGATTGPRPLSRRRKRRFVQGELFSRTWGGARRGAGRKARGPRSRVSHRARGTFRGTLPIHVTMRVEEGLPSLRGRGTYLELMSALERGCERFGMRVVHWAVLGNHVHLIVEASGRRSLTRGMQGLAVRMARALNRRWSRAGRVFADRFHARVLGSPREVRSALAYVLLNARKHRILDAGLDPCSSAPWFEGWRGARLAREPAVARPVWLPRACTWLLSRGWLRWGELDPDHWPSGP